MATPPSKHETDEAERREALRALDDLKRNEPTFAGSHLGHAAKRAADHFVAKDAIGAAGGQTDPVELWGRRIGRALSLIVFIALAIHLLTTYVLR